MTLCLTGWTFHNYIQLIIKIMSFAVLLVQLIICQSHHSSLFGQIFCTELISFMSLKNKSTVLANPGKKQHYISDISAECKCAGSIFTLRIIDMCLQ